MIPLRPYQLAGVEAVRERIRAGKRRIVFVLATGGGKCLGLGTPVLRYDGTIVPVESIRADDLLMGPDSQPRRVLSTTRGRGPLYRIVPVKGEPWVCNDVHVLTLVHTTTGEVVDVDLQTYLRETNYFRHLHKQFAPERGVDFPPARPLPIDPYFLGVWYGDGSKRLDGVALSKPDPEIAELAHATAGGWGLHVRTDGASCPTHHLVGERGAGNPLLDAMREIVGAGTHLPPAYLTCSRRDREAFLAGLLDSDGYLHNGGFEIIQKRRGFAEGIAFLARSLGMRALVAEKRVHGESYWRVMLAGDFSGLPMRIPRKKAAPRQQRKCATRTGFDVAPLGAGEYAGFEIDGDGRFLLGDFTVTHNTVVAAHIVDNAVARGSRVLFVAHRRELIRQTFAKLVRNGLPPASVGVIMAGVESRLVDAVAPPPATLDDAELWRLYARRRPPAPVQVASIDSLRRRARPEADLVVIDECHRALAASYTKLADAYPSAIVLGLTATPYRADGRGLGALFDDLVVIASPRLLVEQGYLVEPTVYGVPPGRGPDLSGVRVTAGDYDAEQLAAAMDKDGLVGDIVEHWQRLGAGERTVVFAASVRHSQRIAERFRAAGVAAEHLDGTTPAAERDAILARLERGETSVVSNCGVLGEGWDCPSVKTLVLARPTKSTGLYLQMAGRILRPWNGARATILDHAGAVHEHGFPTDEREFSLDARKRRAGASSSPPAKTCPECFAVVPSRTRVCSGELADGTLCLYEWPAPEGRDIEERPGELVELRPQTVEEKWAAIVADWERRNAKRAAPFKPGWCAYRWRELHKCALPRSCKLPTLDDDQRARRTRLDELKATAAERGYSDAWVHVQMAGGVQ